MAGDHVFWGSRRVALRAAALTLVLAACHESVGPAYSQTPIDRAKAEIAVNEKILTKAVDEAERACLSNTSSVQQRSLRGTLDAFVRKTNASVGLEEKINQLRGAAQELPASVRLVENEAIRKCMSEYLAPVFAMVVRAYQSAAPNAEWPDPIDFRFKFLRGPSRNAKLYSEYLVLHLRTRGRALPPRRLLVQDPRGEQYFQQDIGYPYPGESVRGSLVAELKGDSQLTAEGPLITDLCMTRPNTWPTEKSTYHDLFECVEGKSCRPSTRATGWLQGCPAAAAGKVFYLPQGTLQPVAYEPGLTRVADVEPALFWRTPSLQSLAERNSEGVGYTVFTIETDRFKTQNITSVEVDVRVNGVSVREDGLPAALRAVGNDPAVPFFHTFALQTLDFEGADKGCDRIELRLKPIMENGRSGAEQIATLRYVALRDVANRSQPFGDSMLRWSASYITPRREWRHLAELHSYVYPSADAAARERMAVGAVEDKRWLDGLGLIYQGKKVVGVVRPPRTIQSDGTAAFGLAAGLVQETGQVRFTFSESDAGALSRFMIDQRRRDQKAARVIDPNPYIFQAIGGSRTVPGVCVDRG